MNRLFLSLFKPNLTSVRYLAAKPGGALGGKVGAGGKKGAQVPVIKKKDLPVETDVTKLVTHCCGINTLKTGGEEVKLKPDSEYPDWLWKISVTGAPALEDMDPNTLDYWYRKKNLALRYKNKLMKNKYPEPFIPKRITNLRENSTVENVKDESTVVNEPVKKVKKVDTSQNKENPIQNIDISKLDLRVGKVIKCEKHPSADHLYVEQIDIGEPILRNVCSGLVKYITPEQLQDQLVILLCNMKATKFKGINSEAMLLCASNAEKTELLKPPENTQIGEKIVVEGFSGELAKEINKKNKIFDLIKVDLKTNEGCIATYKGKPLEITGKGVIKCFSLKNAQIQ